MISERESRSLPPCPVWFRGLEQCHGNLAATRRWGAIHLEGSNRMLEHDTLCSSSHWRRPGPGDAMARVSAFFACCT